MLLFIISTSLYEKNLIFHFLENMKSFHKVIVSENVIQDLKKNMCFKLLFYVFIKNNLINVISIFN